MNFDFQGKKILIMGLGLHGGGVGAAHFFAERGARVTVTDLRTEEQLQESMAKLKKYKDIIYVLGRHRKSDFLRADLIVKNPGVPPTSPYIALARAHNISVTTDVGIFLQQVQALIIGVTGTRGKSTTCVLIFRFLEAFFAKNRQKGAPQVFLGGNIRTSVLDFMDTVTPRDVVVLELSSFQLDDISHDSWGQRSDIRKSPPIAVITNIMRDHLNWHQSMRDYIKAKSIIFLHQTKEDTLFANGADPILRKITAHALSRVVFPQLPKNMIPVIDKNLGTHYRSSVALAIGVGMHFKIPPTLMASVLKKFTGLPGRQEYITNIRGVQVINDTTATIPEASIAAIKRFRALAKKSRLILIAGGSDKHLQFSEMARVVHASVDYLILLPGTATERLFHELTKKKNKLHTLSIKKVLSMKEAVNEALACATKGDYVLLSPGAASFGLFANEFDRGDAFVNEVSKNA